MNFYRELTSDEQVIYKSLFRGTMSQKKLMENLLIAATIMP